MMNSAINNIIFFSDCTTVDKAVQYGHKACLIRLIQAGADVNHASLLRSAITHREPECLKILIQAGADVNLESLLRLAVTHRQTECQQILMRAKTDVNQKSVLSIKTICRKVIRKRLIEMNPRQNLLQTVPKLGLPSSLNNYLLYFMHKNIKGNHGVFFGV